MDSVQIGTLCQQECFTHPVHDIRLIETHISWVILTGDLVYKIKKPVNFGFLDFSTLALRKQCCEEELRLNARASEDLYLAVVPICQRDGKLHMGGDGEILDYAVQMRQFDPSATLVELLSNKLVIDDEFEILGYRVAAFHEIAAAAPSASTWGSVQAVVAPVEENFRQVLERAPDSLCHSVETLAQIAKQDCERLQDAISSRKEQGFVRELHGDLHAGNIARIDGKWVPFDCIEFNPNLRWIDTASDVAFLVMDLEYRGFRSQANRFLNAYLEYSGDYGLLQMLDFYKCYRAMVRAKVAILRWQQTDDGAEQAALLRECEGYLHYGLQLQRRLSARLVMMMGVSGSGKSTIARQVAGEFGLIHLRSDVIRKQLFGLKPNQSSAPSMRVEVYSAQASHETFQQMQMLTHQLLIAGYSVVLDATFIRRDARAPFLALAQNLNAPLTILHCNADATELERRIRHRLAAQRDASEADVDVMHSQLKQVEILQDDESARLVEVGVQFSPQQLTQFFSDE